MEEVFHFTSQTGKILQPLKTDKKKITKTSTKILRIFPIRSFFVSFFNSM